MASENTAIQPALTRDETGTLLGQTMGLVAVTTGLFAVGAYVGRDIAYQWGWLFFIGSFVLLFGLNFAAQRSKQADADHGGGRGVGDDDSARRTRLEMRSLSETRRADGYGGNKQERAWRHG